MHDQRVPVRDRLPVVGDRVLVFRTSGEGGRNTTRGYLVEGGLYLARARRGIRSNPDAGTMRYLVEWVVLDPALPGQERGAELILLHMPGIPSVHFGVAFTSPETVVFVEEEGRPRRLPVTD